jgi:ATP-dependent Clp protease ATP-binding subunit ClpB
MLTEEVCEQDIAEVVSKWTGIPVSKMLSSERQKLVRMEEVLSRRVVGQELAIATVSDAVRRSRAGLSDPRRPMGSFIFLGPTGVGKTELARTLAEFMFDDENAMIRIDMSEYMEKHTVARLIGAPPGYVGYDEGGQLTESIRRRPYSVILLDEIEKAHSDVFNVLLQVLDHGMLTDGKGRHVNFKNTLVIMTSNIGSQIIQEHAGNTEKIQELVQLELKARFKPEFLNRVDDIIFFNNLARDHIEKIVGLQLNDLKTRLEAGHISAEFSPAVITLLANLGYDPAFGARPLKRVIQKQVENELAMQVLNDEIHSGQNVYVDVKKGNLVFNTRMRMVG